MPFKGQLTLKQYNAHKSKTLGYKLHVLSNLNGLICVPWSTRLASFRKYSNEFTGEHSETQGSQTFIDNWYKAVNSIGNKSDKPGNCFNWNCLCLQTNKLHYKIKKNTQKKEGRATIAIKMCKSDVAELHATKWFNNHAASIMTIYKATEHKIKNMRYKGKRRVIFECPPTTAIWE